MPRGIYPALRRRMMWKSLALSRGIMRRRLGRRYSRRRIMGRMMRRRIKPELKYVNVKHTQTSIPISSTVHSTWTPTVITKGPEIGQRNGDQVKFLRTIGRMEIGVAPLVVGSAGRLDSTLRVVLWSPRVTPSVAQSYMDLLTYLEPIDFNTINVFYDKLVTLGTISSATQGVTTNVLTPTLPQRRMFYLKFNFPRKIRFTPTNTSVPEDCIMHISFINPSSVVSYQFQYETRTTYVDN